MLARRIKIIVLLRPAFLLLLTVAIFVITINPAFADAISNDGPMDYHEAKTGAMAGHADAQYNLGSMYAHGIGVTQDLDIAKKWYALAAKQNYPGAQKAYDEIANSPDYNPKVSNSASLTNTNNETTGNASVHGAVKDHAQDNLSSAESLRTAAEQGDAKSQFILGVYYCTGINVKEDDGSALNWWHRASDQGYSDASLALMNAYQEGWGIEKDPKEANNWGDKALKQSIAEMQKRGNEADQSADPQMFRELHPLNFNDAQLTVVWVYMWRKAAEQGDASSQYQLGNAYHRGVGVKKDNDEGLKWLRKAADQGEADAQAMLGDAYHNGWGVAKDDKEAAKWLHKAVIQGNDHARGILLGSFARIDPTILERNAQEEKEYLESRRKRADQGDAFSQYNLGNAYHEGIEGVERDDKQAFIWWHKAAEQDFAAAEDGLGMLYYTGSGVEKDDKQAIFWWQKSASRENLGILAQLLKKESNADNTNTQQRNISREAILQGVDQADKQLFARQLEEAEKKAGLIACPEASKAAVIQDSKASIIPEAPRIVDYKPSAFTEQPTSPFFFRIGDKLKFGSVISEDAPSLFEGKFSYVHVSPDQKKAAIVGEGNLYLAEAGKPIVTLLNGGFNNLFTLAMGNYKPQGSYYENINIQWDADSQSVYLIRETPKQPEDGQPRAFQNGYQASIVRINIDNPNKVIEVVPEFSSFQYFFVGKDGICFDFSPDDKNLIWRCKYQGSIKNVKFIQEDSISLEDGTSIKDKPFFSYNGIPSDIFLTLNGFHLQETDVSSTELYSKNKPDSPIFTVKDNPKWHQPDGIRGGMVLPGGRYAVLYIFDSILLIDSVTGKYKELPPKVAVYQNLNTSTYKNVDMSIDHFGFMPVSEWRIHSPKMLKILSDEKSRKDSDRVYRQQAAKKAYLSSNQPITWNNPETGDSGSFMFIGEYRNLNVDSLCRRDKELITDKGKTGAGTIMGESCQNKDGTWDDATAIP